MHTHKLALTILTTSLCGFGLAACDTGGGGPDLGRLPDFSHPADLTPAAPKGVYTMSNDATGNMLMIYLRAPDGTLRPGTPVATGGRGTGASLGDQNGLIFDPVSENFFVVNAGDNTLSMMSLKTDGTVTLVDQVLSGGVSPVSVTMYQNTVYVVNAGSTFSNANITGFQVSGTTLTPIANSTKNLSVPNAGAGPAQIQFSPDGTLLVVTEKTTSKIDTFTVSAGVATGPMAQTSNGMTPFGFAFSSSGKLIVSESNNATANQGSASSYSIASNGTLTSVTNKLVDGQTAPCWTVVSGTTAYLSNAHSNNISAYKIGSDGTLTLNANGMSGTTGNGPTDEAVTSDNQFLYVLNSMDHSLSTFAINSDGSLTKKADYQGLPIAAEGLVAR